MIVISFLRCIRRNKTATPIAIKAAPSDAPTAARIAVSLHSPPAVSFVAAAVSASLSSTKESVVVQLPAFHLGRFGRVYLARERQSGFVCALKVLHKGEIQDGRVEKQVAREIGIQRNLHHPNIIQLCGQFILILEEEGLKEWKAAQYIAQMASALRSLHGKHAIHRDMNPENILVGLHGELKMADFGWSVHAPSGRRLTMCGTLDYLPPEMVDPKRRKKPFDKKDTPTLTHRRIMKGDMTIPAFLLVLEPNQRIALKKVQQH
ncbi:kinase-like domain-containing protein [Aspergillus filifer]